MLLNMLLLVISQTQRSKHISMIKFNIVGRYTDKLTVNKLQRLYINCSIEFRFQKVDKLTKWQPGYLYECIITINYNINITQYLPTIILNLLLWQTQIVFLSLILYRNLQHYLLQYKYKLKLNTIRYGIKCKIFKYQICCAICLFIYT